MNKQFKNIILHIQKNFNVYDKTLIKKNNIFFNSYNQKPIFIIGPPRSGSTLLFQMLTSNVESIYFTNLMALVPKYLVFTSKISQKKFTSYQHIKSNYYGYTPGIHGANEAGKIFKKWFVTDGVTHTKSVRNTIVGLSNVYNLPLLAKPLTIINNLDTVQRILPEVRFVVIKRDILMNAQSLIIARQKINNDIHKWWSTEIENYESVLNKSPFYQVFWQIDNIYSKIDKFIKTNNTEVIYTSYENFCLYPEREILNIVNTFDLNLKNGNKINNQEVVKNNNTQKLNSNDWVKLNYYYNKYYKWKNL